MDCSRDRPGELLWTPQNIHNSHMDKFRRHVNDKFSLNLDSYNALYKWSIEKYSDFWDTWWSWGQFLSSQSPTQVVTPHASIVEVPRWFPGAKMNFAQNLLRYRDDRVAIYEAGEGREVSAITYRQLYHRTMTYSRALSHCGVNSATRIVGYLPNCAPAVEAMLGTAVLGATWSSASPDFGVTGVVERFSQIQPAILFSVEAVRYNGKVHDNLGKLEQVVKALPSLKKVIIVPFVHSQKDIDISTIPHSEFLDTFLKSPEEDDQEELEFTQVPFHHPMFIMFSSGTTGAPKCMVHSVGGSLIQIAKEHILHCDMRRSDVFMYYTTTGWMVWNWLVVGLFSGCSLVLYDGSPLLPTPDVLWDLVDHLGISILGTGAKWLQVLESRGVHPMKTHDLSSLRAILSTGSPLSPQSFSYVYNRIKKNLMLGSISGGTDIISCFIGCNPTLPVYSGEIQCRLLGMSVEAWVDEGVPGYDVSGELVCTRPFPSMPTHFCNDEGNIKYTKAYFAKYSNTWNHGDYCMISSATGGVTMLGRSDGTLNPNGVRFGSSEIYNIVDKFVEVSDSVCVGQRRPDGEERVVLFLKLHPQYTLDQGFIKRLSNAIRTHLSARHVPAIMLPIADVPYTVSGKKVEVAVRKVIQGEPVVSIGALANPEALELYQDLPQLRDW